MFSAINKSVPYVYLVRVEALVVIITLWLLQDTASAGYWIPDMTNQCFHGWHLRWTGFVAVPGLLLLSIPLAFAALLWRRRHELITDVCKQKLGYAYKSYRQVVLHMV